MTETNSLPDATPPSTGEPIWSVWTAIVFVALWFSLLLVVNYSSIAIAAWLSRPALAGTDAFGLFFEQFLGRLAENPWSRIGQAASVALTWLITFKLIELFFRGVPRSVLGNALGIRSPSPRWSLAAAVPFGLAAFALAEWISFLIQTDDGPFLKELATIPGFIGTALLAVVIAPPAEEIFFRGFLYPPMRRAFSPGTAILLNGALFAGVHTITYGLDAAFLLPILVLGLLTAWLRDWTGSIWPCVVVHAIFNGTSLLMFLLSKAGLVT